MLTITQVKNVFVQSGRNIYTNILVFWKTVVYNASSVAFILEFIDSGVVIT